MLDQHESDGAGGDKRTSQKSRGLKSVGKEVEEVAIKVEEVAKAVEEVAKEVEEADEAALRVKIIRKTNFFFFYK